MRITVACPEGLIDIGNRLFAPAFPETEGEAVFQTASWVNTDGAGFACASWEMHAPDIPLKDNASDPDWALVDSWLIGADTAPLETRSDRITALIGLAGADAICAMSLSVMSKDQAVGA